MTSRRSRLKAVTNLPVRRKTLTSQGNGNETADNLAPEKVYPAKAEEIIGVINSSQPTHVEVKDINDIPNKNSGNDSSVPVNCDVGFQNNENSIKEVVNSKVDEPNSSDVLDNSNDLNKTCNVYSSKNESGSGFRSNKRFKPNLISASIRERSQTQEKTKENESSKELNCITISNNSFNSNSNNNNSNNNNNNNNNNNDNISNNNSNNNNSIVEDGFKCYTVLTPQNLTIPPLSEYTITSLTPCSNAFIDANINDVEPPQDYQEVQIYTDIEPTEIYINENNENCESVIEVDTLQPVLTNLTNCSSEHELKGVKYEFLNSNLTELKSVPGNFERKSATENRTLSVKNNFNVNDDYSGAQTRDYTLESTASSGSQNVSSELPSQKQSISALRRRRLKYNDFTKKLADAKREFQKKYEKTKPDRSTLKMIDLIFYNPATNPMESKGKFDKKDTTVPSADVIHDLLAEEKVDEPESVDCQVKSNLSDSNEMENMNKMPVPQVKIGVDGEIILDEKSLIIETTDAKKGREGLQNSVPIFEDREYKVSYYRGKSKKTKDWADFETKRFYKALNTIGPDFTLMQKYFPKRSRLELKNKFKREERLNRNLIDKALNNPSEFDMTQLEKDLAIEIQAEQGELDVRLTKMIKHASRKPRVRGSFLSREIIETDEDSDDSQQEPFESKMFSDSEKTKKEKEFDFVFQKLLMKESKKSVSVLPEISSSSAQAFQYSDHGVT